MLPRPCPCAMWPPLRGAGRACGLTPREGEILGYLGRGHGIAFVADALVISESTGAHPREEHLQEARRALP